MGADYCKMSISIIKLLFLFHDCFDILSKSEFEKNRKNLFIINIIVSIVFPIIMIIATFFGGDVRKSEHNNFCYHVDQSYRIIVYFCFMIYYLIFFGLTWNIILVIRRKSYPISEVDNLSSEENIDNRRLKRLICYTIMITINSLIFFSFLILFILKLIDKDIEYASNILGNIFEPLTIPFFLVFIGMDVNDNCDSFMDAFSCKKKIYVEIVEDKVNPISDFNTFN